MNIRFAAARFPTAVALVSTLALTLAGSCTAGPGGGSVVLSSPPPVSIVPLTAAQPFDDRLPPRERTEPSEHVPAPWPFDIKRYAIDLTLEPSAHAISGRVTIDVEDRADGLAEFALDAVDLQVSRVTATASPPHDVPFSYDGKKLRIPLDEPRRSGTARTFVVEYSGHPVRGLYFNDADPQQVFTQGECEDARHWLPCHDFPDDRATHTITVHAPKGWSVVAAGKRRDEAGATASFEMDVPHTAYLTTMVAGKYETVTEKGVVPLLYVVDADSEKFAAANFRKTDAILRFFGDYTGLPYPYPKYSQTCVHNFMFGGMENISATTLTDTTIHPPDWEPSRSSTGLVAHEAAHQWFGDWITCADWSHCWLNEGFATYFDLLFTEHDEGRDEFLLDLRGTRNGALSAMERDRRAVVSNKYAEPMDLFGGHAYPGGAARLHMLRHLLGDDAFREAIRHYVKKCGLTCVRTDDFRKAVEESCGKDLAWFFDQWFLKPGCPKLTVRWKPVEGRNAALVTVEQTQKTDGGVPDAYRLPLDVDFVLQSGATHRQRLDVVRRKQDFTLELPEPPSLLRVDPETALLVRYELDRSIDDWIRELASDPNPALRQDAVEALAGIAKDEKRAATDREKAQTALLDGLTKEKMAQLRASLLRQIASRKDESTVDLFVRAMNSDPDLRVRLAAGDALDSFEECAKARDAFALHLEDDNDLVRAAAVTAVAKLRHPQAYAWLMAQVDRPGWHSVVRNAALRGFSELGDERAFPTLVRCAASDDRWSRTTAIELLGRMGRKRPEYLAAVLPYLDDSDRTIRRAAASAMGTLGDVDSIPILCEHFQRETWPGVKDALRSAVGSCRRVAVDEGRLVTVETIRAARLRDEHAAKRDEVDAMETSCKDLKGDAKTEAEARLKTRRDELSLMEKELGALGVPPKEKPKPAKPPAPQM